MTILEFVSNSPWISFFLALVIGEIISILFYKLPNRIIRGMNIRKHGWPPEHCDADGDFKKEDNNETP